MTITSSLELYNNACREAENFGKPGTGMADNYMLYGTNSSHVDRRAAYLEPYYIRIIEAMFFELVTGGRSPLLSLLCSRNGICPDLENIRIDYTAINQGTAGAFDLKPLLDGLNTAFSGNLSRCSTLYFGTYSKYVFQGMVFDKAFDQAAWISKELEKLDRQMGKIRSRECLQDSEAEHSVPEESEEDSAGNNTRDKDAEGKLADTEPGENRAEDNLAGVKPEISPLGKIFAGENIEQKDGKTDIQTDGETDIGKEEKPDKSVQTAKIPREKLEQIAAGRREADKQTSELLAELQKAIQEELGQIRQIREGVEYNYVLEAVLQLIELYMQIDDILRYHPDTTNPESYANLVDSCYEFRSNILQSLAFLGVTPISRIDVPYDPQFYQIASGARPIRGSRVLKVLRPGFVFKEKVLEKALAEIS